MADVMCVNCGLPIKPMLGGSWLHISAALVPYASNGAYKYCTIRLGTPMSQQPKATPADDLRVALGEEEEE